jgi:hypothetical protein
MTDDTVVQSHFKHSSSSGSICIERMALRPVACNSPACAHCACIGQLVLEPMGMLDKRSAGTAQPAVSEVVAA